VTVYCFFIECDCLITLPLLLLTYVFVLCGIRCWRSLWAYMHNKTSTLLTHPSTSVRCARFKTYVHTVEMTMGMGFPMGMGRNGNRLHGNGREWECKKPFPGISCIGLLPQCWWQTLWMETILHVYLVEWHSCHVVGLQLNIQFSFLQGNVATR